MAKPLRVLDMEYVDEVWDYGGRPMRAMKITFDRESTERIRNGYACAKCLAVFDRAWPVNCPECGAPVRARQAEFLAREYGGVENYVRSWDEEFERLARRGHQLRKPVSIAVKGEVNVGEQHEDRDEREQEGGKGGSSGGAEADASDRPPTSGVRPA